MSNEKIDKTVLDLWNKVRNQKKEIEAIQRPTWLTNCSLQTDPNNVNTAVNIQTVTDVTKLVDLYAHLNLIESARNAAANEMGFKASNKWQASTFEEWRKDIKTRVALIGVNDKRKNLAELEKRLDNLLTVDQKRELELAEIAKELE